MAEEHYEGDSGAVSPLIPTPLGTPYQIPLLASSRRSSSKTVQTSSAAFASPILPPDFDDSTTSRQNGNLSGKGADSFTPTLHASLVSEILSLRRDIESKTGFIERLETSLSQTRNENESLQEDLNKSAKETRETKRQLQSIEDGTLSALEDIAKERDEAKEAAVDLKKRLDVSQNKLKVQQDNTDRSQRLWEQEKSEWQHKKTVVERRAKIAESRLKQVLQEFAAREAVLEQERQEAKDNFETNSSTLPEAQSSPVAKVKAHARARSSISSLSSLRKAGEDSTDANKLSLADELLADDIEEDEEEAENSETEHDPFTSDSPLKNARLSRQIDHRVDEAMKVLGVNSTDADQPADSYAPASTTRDLEIASELLDSSSRREDSDNPPLDVPIADLAKEQTADPLNGDVGMPTSNQERTAVVTNDSQFSAPGSYGLDNAATRGFGTERNIQHTEIEANQRRKRDPATSSAITHARTKSDPSPQSPKSTTNIAHALDSPTRPTEISAQLSEQERPSILKPEFVSVATQTELHEESQAAEAEQSLPTPTRETQPVPLAIPSIEIHPPESAQASPTAKTASRIGTQDAGSQTEGLPTPSSRSFGMQTEAIRIDQRSIKLPPHLLPSSISSEPPSAEKAVPRNAPEIDLTKTRLEYYGSESLPSTPTLPPLEEYEGEDGSPSQGVVERPMSTPTASHLLAFEEEDTQSSWSRIKKSLMSSGRQSRQSEPDSVEDLDDSLPDGFDRDSLQSSSRLSKRQQKMTKPFDPPTPVPENEKATINRSSMHSRATTSAGSKSSFERTRKSKSAGYTYRPPPPIPKSTSIARSTRSGSPGAASFASSSNWSKTSAAPPFVIPTRSSSKGVSRRKRTDGPSSPTPRSSGSSPKRDGRGLTKPSLRKSRSEIVLPESTRADKAATPATPLSAASFNSDDKHRPLPPSIPLSFKKISLETQRSSGSQSWNVNSVVPTGNAYVGSSVQHTVVDAIAATMVGEWMYKYTRKRKSFGVPDSPQDFSKAGDVRHKRWVWVSPHERVVLWSNKQPTSNSALMGKNGRKLPIQSVLDVKDDAPAPKGVDAKNIFNRSILVLTPSRALKFTAVARERHYLWLTALSFLAHHTSQGFLDLSFLPPTPSFQPQESQPESRSRSRSNSTNQASAGNGRKRWSFSRDKTRSQQSSGYATPAIPESEIAAPHPVSRMATIAQNPDKSTSQSKPEEAAFAPAIPRVPHSRKRSASGPTGGSTSRGASPLQGIRSVNTSFLSSAASAGATALSSTQTLPAGSRGSKSGASSVRNIRQHSSSPIVDEEDEAEDAEIRGLVSSVEAARLIFGPSKEHGEGPGSPSFGVNQNFFDAAGGISGGNNNTIRLDAFAAPGMRPMRGVGGTQQARPASAWAKTGGSRSGGFADANVESAKEASISHGRQLTEDSVAPPNILKAPPMPDHAPPPVPKRASRKAKAKAIFGV